jgi:hypothetical protein
VYRRGVADPATITMARRRRGEELVAGMDVSGAWRGSEERLVVGSLGIAMAAVVLLSDTSHLAGRLFGWTALLLIAAIGLVVTGLEGLRRRNRRIREVERAVAQWGVLRAGLADQKDAAWWLRQLGYREFEVRRWIEREVRREIDRDSSASGQ